MPKYSGIALPAIFCTMLWGSAVPMVKTGYELFKIDSADSFAKLAFAGYRFTLAGLIVLLIVLMLRRPVLPKKDAWGGILALCLMQSVMQYIFYYLGLSSTSGVRGSVLSATSTFFSVIAAHFAFSSDKITPRKAIGCAVGFMGVIVMLSGNGLGNEAITFTGEGFMIISAIGQGVGAVISRKITPGRDPLLITGWQLFIGGIVLLLIGALGGGASRMTITTNGILLVIYLAVLSAAAFCIWTTLLKYHPVAKVAIYMFLIPVFGSLLSAVLLNETILTVQNIMALILVCGGITFVNRAKLDK